ncbi:beta-lactamase family protein [Luteimonas sp. SX5]|uniref:Beta-lactamase family protein n=1 Tax=Luteimonas galliterrae TaxID=2940486 RepID=A0ABT0MFJ3_9GAMM|nr:serine hydrolase domain-containing protein [Luteimonas galliterrae]MCL1633622.1 beta-lactamase family protein [Luteimonas galliterrae]
MLSTRAARKMRLLCLLISTAAYATSAAAETTKSDPYASIRSDIETEIAAGRLTGVSVALVKDGRIVWEQGFGWADREARRPATAHTAFSVASTTKPFTTTALMTLAAAGELDLDRPANDYLGAEKIVDANGPAQQATVRRLATHSSGLPTFFAMYPEGGDAVQPGIPELVRDYGRLVAPVGERYEYSNLAMGILAEIVARRSKQEFGRYLRDRVLRPLGMNDSFFDTDLSRRAEMAVRYADDGKPLPFYLTATPGSGELYASAHDLARFAMLHLGGQGLDASARILDKAQLDELHRPATTVAPGGFYYGMGWQVLRQPGRPEVLYHGGGQSGVKTEFVLVPSAGVACIVLSNRRGGPGFIDGVRDRMLRTVVDDWRGIPTPPSPPLQPLRPVEDYAGVWRGTMVAQGKRLPVVLSVTDASTGTLSVGNGDARPIADFGLIDGLVSGESHGHIGSADTIRERLDQLSLNLKLRGDRIDGEIVAWRKTSESMAMFPYWVELQRDEAR